MTDQNISTSLSNSPQSPAGRLPDSAWQVQDAKARFSEMLDASLTEGPQIITRRGAEIAAVVPIEQWRRLESAVPSLKDLLLEPGVASGAPPPPRPERYFNPADRLERSESAAYLLDAGVIVALLRRTRGQAVLDWITGVPANRLHISAMAVGVIQRVVEETRAKGTTTDTLMAQELEEWLLRLRCAYGVLAADAVTFREWARLVHRHPGTELDVAMNAATALVHGLTVVTGNVEYFELLGLPTINPFEPTPRPPARPARRHESRRT